MTRRDKTRRDEGDQECRMGKEDQLGRGKAWINKTCEGEGICVGEMSFGGK